MKTRNQQSVRSVAGALAAILVVGFSVLPARASVFPPATGLQAWYQADTGVTVTGSGVSLWDDQTVNNNDATQTTDSARPALSTANIGLRLNVPVITFGVGGSPYDQLNLPNINQASGGGATVYFLINNDADVAQGINKNWMNRSAGPGLYGNPNGFGASGVGFIGDGGGDGWQAESSAVTGWKVVRASWVNGALGNYQTFMTNFTAGASASEAFGPATTGNWVSIGYNGYPGDQYTLSSFAEVLIYNRSLSAAENQQVLDYFHQEFWSIPEPSTALLFGLGGLLLYRARRKSS